MKTTIACLAALTLTCVVAQSAPNHHWPLNTNLQDVQGLNNGNAPNPGTHVPGPVQQGYTHEVWVNPWTTMQGDWAVSMWFNWKRPTTVVGDDWSKLLAARDTAGGQGVGVSIVEASLANIVPELAGEVGSLILVIANKQWLVPGGWKIRNDRWYHLSLSVQGTSFNVRLRDAYGNERAAVLVANALPIPITSDSKFGFGDENGNVLIDDVRAWTTNAKAEADATYSLAQPRKRLVVEVAGSVTGPWDAATTVEIPVFGISEAEFFRMRFEDVGP